MSPELRGMIARVQTRWRLRALAWTLALAATTFATVFVVSIALGDPVGSARVTALIATVIAGIVSALRQRRLSTVDAARVIEASHDVDNLIVTAAELDATPRPVRAEIRDAILEQAAARSNAIDVARVVPLAQPILVAVLAIAGAAAFAAVGTDSRLRPRPVALAGNKGPGLFFAVRVTPPAYAHRKVELFENPVEVTALAGSRINIETADQRVLRDWIATESEGIELENIPGPFPRKFLMVNVIRDRGPEVRVVTPGKDSAFAEPKGRVDIAIQSTDDLGLSSLALRFTKASGGGENVAFTDGEVPLTIERRGDAHWTARATLDVGSLGLADGDVVVYRAIARDTNPQGTPVQSEQYLIEIGKNAEIADAGFALPSEEKKYAISQQMVIYRTEQLIARLRQGLSSASLRDEWMDDVRGVAVEQRMVRAEVVFLGGGEVEDEVEEAAKSDELTEGRLQNTGRAEMLRAINAMSRAEAQLNDGRAEEALVFEREALASLERALDRRRYFLRTLPDRSRIDTGRRLTGDRRDARSWERRLSGTEAMPAIQAQRELMRDLASNPQVDARLAARVAAIDPSSTPLQQAAVALASAATDEARRSAIDQAMRALADHALRTLPASSTIDVTADPLAGRLATELAARPRQ